MSSSPPPMGPRSVRTRPLAGARSLLAERASWLLHRELRGHQFETEAELRRFVAQPRGPVDTPLPADAAPWDRAQELFYESREVASAVEARLKRKAGLRVAPDHVDLLVDQARFDIRFRDRLAALDKAVVLGDAFAAEAHRAEGGVDGDAGSEWGVLTNRPALRARAARALHLVDLGRIEEAIDACAELLRLDPDDHQGARYVRVALLLEAGRYEEVRRSLEHHGVETSSIFAWADVLLEWATEGDAEEALYAAHESNADAEAFLLEPEMIEVPPPEVSAAGSLEEAEIVGDLLWRAWHARPEAVAWLRARAHEDLRSAPVSPVWERILEADEEELREGMLPFLLPRREAVTARLRDLVGQGFDPEMPHVGEWAVRLLRRLGRAADAVPELVHYLSTYPSVDMGVDNEAVKTLSELGAAATPTVLEAHAKHTDLDARAGLVEVLARSRVPSDEIFAILCQEFEDDTVIGAGLLGDYGDARALPLLSEHLDRADPDPHNPTAGVPDLVDAIEQLGGALTPHQQERFATVLENRARWESPEGQRELEEMLVRLARKHGLVDEGPPLSSTPPPSGSGASRRDRPGRNEPCWCGSGQKYKRCHLREDEDGAP